MPLQRTHACCPKPWTPHGLSVRGAAAKKSAQHPLLGRETSLCQFGRLIQAAARARRLICEGLFRRFKAGGSQTAVACRRSSGWDLESPTRGRLSASGPAGPFFRHRLSHRYSGGHSAASTQDSTPAHDAITKSSSQTTRRHGKRATRAVVRDRLRAQARLGRRMALPIPDRGALPAAQQRTSPLNGTRQHAPQVSLPVRNRSCWARLR